MAFAQRCGSGVILRGLRAMSDFEYELQIAHTNKSLAPQLETLFLATATAHSFLSSSFQKEISPASLQAKWLGLQRETGSFVKVGRAVEAESTPDMRLVLVNVDFNRLSDNLYVILDGSNHIIGVDFPENPAGPAPVR